MKYDPKIINTPEQIKAADNFMEAITNFTSIKGNTQNYLRSFKMQIESLLKDANTSGEYTEIEFKYLISTLGLIISGCEQVIDYAVENKDLYIKK